MATPSVEELLKRWQKAETRKEHWRSIYEEAYEYCLPQRNLYNTYDSKTPGQSKMNKIFDSTAINSTQRFANRLQSSLFPPYRDWCRLVPGNAVPDDQRGVIQQGLEVYRMRMFAMIQQSNFDLALGEFLLDLAVGTAVMLVERGSDLEPLRFTPVPQYLVAIEEGPHGTVENVYRRLRMRPENIQRHYLDANLNKEIEEAKVSAPEEEIELLEVTLFDEDRGDYSFCVIHPATKHKLLMRYMRTSPWIVARYSKTAGEVYGRGPCLWALPDIKTINKTKELLLKGASLSIAPMFTAADDGVLNPENINIAPGAIIPVARNGGPQGPSLAPMPRSSDVQLSQLILQDLQISIKKMMLDDTLPRDDMSARSATEIAERTRELAQNLGSAFGRLVTETMVPLVRRILDVLDESGIITLPLRVNGREGKIEAVSPLAQAQSLEEVNQVTSFLQVTQLFGEQGQMSIKSDAIIEYIADRMNIPANLRTTPQEREQMQMMQMMQMQQMQQMQGQQAAPAEVAPA